jgi:transcriptional regulator with XRE-family HTH domain
MDHAILFGRRLRSLRMGKNLKQRQLAEQANMSSKYVSQLETGSAQPSFDALVAFSRILDVPMSSFFLFDLDESDPKVLRKRIARIVEESRQEDLKQIYRLIRDVVEP